MASKHLPKFELNNGTVEGLKWLALLLMTGDHVNKYLFNGSLPVFFEAGRLAMPIFVSLLAYNLARPNAFKNKVYKRTAMRLAIFGLIATVPFIALGHVINGWWPLNILFTLLAITVIAYLIERNYIITAVSLFLFSGALVEFCWPALGLGLAIWSYTKEPTLKSATIALLSCLSLIYINGNIWAIAVFPILFMASQIDFRIPRLRWIFYVYYPAHLTALWIIRIPMSNAGYLFFY